MYTCSNTDLYEYLHAHVRAYVERERERQRVSGREREKEREKERGRERSHINLPCEVDLFAKRDIYSHEAQSSTRLMEECKLERERSCLFMDSFVVPLLALDFLQERLLTSDLGWYDAYVYWLFVKLLSYFLFLY